MYRYVTYVRIYYIVYIQVYYTYESKSPHCSADFVRKCPTENHSPRLGFKLLGSKMQRSCSEVATWGIGKIHRENAGNTWDSWENLWGLNVVLNGNVWEWSFRNKGKLDNMIVWGWNIRKNWIMGIIRMGRKWECHGVILWDKRSTGSVKGNSRGK